MKIKHLLAIGLISAFVRLLHGQQFWTQTTLNTNANWYAVACSADGSKMVTGDAGPSSPGGQGQFGIWYSTDLGFDWNQANAPTNAGWGSFAVSADGTKMFAADGGYITNNAGFVTNNGIWLSTDSGTHWNQSLAQTNNGPNMVFWFSIACSADGSKLAAIGNVYGLASLSGVYTSTNSGTTWQQRTNAPVSQAWRWICSSADGTHLAAVFNYDPHLGIVVSTNSGATWAQANAPTNTAWQTVVCTPDGGTLAAVGNAGGLFWVSTNSGATWFQQTSLTPDNGNFAVATSANASHQIVVGPDGIYASTNGGLNWAQETNEPNPDLQWETVASSADGGAAVAANYNPSANGGAVFFTTLGFVPHFLSLALAGTNAVISWIIPSRFYDLEKNSDLTTTSWSFVTNQPVLNLTNLENQVIVPATNNAFYELHLGL